MYFKHMDFKRIDTIEKVRKNVDGESGKTRRKSGKSPRILFLKCVRHPE